MKSRITATDYYDVLFTFGNLISFCLLTVFGIIVVTVFLARILSHYYHFWFSNLSSLRFGHHLQLPLVCLISSSDILLNPELSFVFSIIYALLIFTIFFFCKPCNHGRGILDGPFILKNSLSPGGAVQLYVLGHHMFSVLGTQRPSTLPTLEGHFLYMSFSSWSWKCQVENRHVL